MIGRFILESKFLFMNQSTQRVVHHLQGISQKMLAALNDLPKRREIIDEYFRVDGVVPSVAATVTADRIGDIPVEWVCDDDADPNCRILYIHGGSWISGSLEGYRSLASLISAASGASVLVVDYRLAPENKFPAGLNDCVSAWSWMLDNGPSQASKASSAFICGDSAGGNLTLASYLALKNQGIALPNGLIALSPATDFTAASPSLQTHGDRDPIIHPLVYHALRAIYLDNDDIENPLVSPLFGDYHDAPPILVQVGDAEVLLDDSLRLVERARAQGSEATVQVWKNMPHVFQGFAPDLPEANDAIESIARFINHYS